MATLIYHGPDIWVGSPGEQTWWFHSSAWKPGDWLRASFIGKHSSTFEGCHLFRGNVQILEEWTETKTTEDCGELRPESVDVVHWVRFRISGHPGQAFEPMSVRTRFARHT